MNDKEKPSKYTGRPTLYREEYCDKLIDWMAEGKSFVTFASTIPCNPDTIAEWVKVHERFSEAKKIGKILEQTWWDNLHRRCAATGEGNITAIVWAQKNKFPKSYKERLAKGVNQVQLQQTHNQTLTHAITGNMQQLIATMTAEQAYEIALALENRHKELETVHGKEATNTKNITRTDKCE